MLPCSDSSVGGLYVHVPFCVRKCDYCAFYSEPSAGERIDRFVQALIRELELVHQDLKPRTVFFGGGTPSLLNPQQWRQILQAMERFGLLGADEWTIECNPATVSPDKAQLWRSFGVNRISLGVQSLDQTLLDRLGRVHDRSMVFRSVDLLRRAGFSNLNFDLMFAIPGQTLESWRSTLDEVMALGSEHLSVTRSPTKRTHRSTPNCRPDNMPSTKTRRAPSMKNCSVGPARVAFSSMKSRILPGRRATRPAGARQPFRVWPAART